MTGQDTRRDFLAGRALLRLADRAPDHPIPSSIPVAGATIRLETRAMACPWAVVLNPGPPCQVMVASDALYLVHPIEQLLSIYLDSSPIAQLKTMAPGELRKLPPEVFSLLLQCQHLAEMTHGAFDPTSGPVVRLWRDCRQAGRIPEADEIATALLCCGMRRVIELDISTQSIRSHAPHLEVDLGAIGKGYAIDRISELMLTQFSIPPEVPHSRERNSSPQPTPAPIVQTHDCASFLVHGGFSSLRAHGTHHGLDGWPVGLKNPLFPDRDYATIVLKDQSLATSGSNVQFFRHHGQRYGHILDPRTGWPVQGMLSVTVIAPSAAEADALSTAFYVMGINAAADYCQRHPEIGAILVPPVTEGRSLAPRIMNIPEEVLFFHTSDDTSVR